MPSVSYVSKMHISRHARTSGTCTLRWHSDLDQLDEGTFDISPQSCPFYAHSHLPCLGKNYNNPLICWPTCSGVFLASFPSRLPSKPSASPLHCTFTYTTSLPLLSTLTTFTVFFLNHCNGLFLGVLAFTCVPLVIHLPRYPPLAIRVVFQNTN